MLVDAYTGVKTLHLMVGLPRAGKSTRAREMGYPIVSPDAVRIALHGHAFNPEAEAMVWTITRYMIKALFAAGHTDVILDSTNISREYRRRWRSRKWRVKLVELRVSYQECLERAHASQRPDLIPVIRSMSTKYEGTTKEEEKSLNRFVEEGSCSHE